MDIEAIKRRLLVKYPFFGSVVANSSFIANSSLRVAGTDGESIYYNPDFIESVTDDQKTFIFAHEICHIAFNHIFRSEGKDKELWNIATDSVINALLKQDGLPMVEGGVDIPEAINYDAEEMYKKLLKEQQQKHNNKQDNNNQANNLENKKEQYDNSDNQNKQNNTDSSSNSEQDKSEEKADKNHNVGHDSHSLWRKAIEEKHKKDQSQAITPEDEEQEKNMSNENKKIIELGERESFKQNKIERKKQLDELRKALVSQSLGCGNDTDSEIRNITDIGISKPLIDWRKFLKDAVKYDVDWSYQNAEIEDSVITPHLEEIPRPETEIVLDTSGSIDEVLLRNFLRECKNILKTSRVKVGCFDTEFYGFHEIKNEKDIDNLSFLGGGGTYFDVAVNAFTKRVENKIIFTDGEADMPSTSIDAIWIVFGDEKINPKGGRVIYIDNNQLDKLYNYQMTDKTNGKSR